MENISAEIGTRIRLCRQRAGLSQERLALNAGLTVSFLEDIERGVKKPSVVSLEKLLAALDISFLKFFDFETEIRPLKDCTALEKLSLMLKDRPNDEVEMICAVAENILAFNNSRIGHTP
jgi:transcriptional regulator with XRE-family HTH domain